MKHPRRSALAIDQVPNTIIGILILVAALLTVVTYPQAKESTAVEGTTGPLKVEAEIAKAGDFMAFGFDSLWMMSSSRLVRVNATNNSLIEIKLEGARGAVRGIAVGENAVWIADTGSKMIYKIDPTLNKMVLSIPAAMTGQTEGSIGVGEGAVWAVTEHDLTLTRFNAENGEVEAKILLPGACAGVVVDYGSVWLTNSIEDKLYRVDSKTNSVTATIALDQSPRFITSGFGSVWVLNQNDGTVQRIDPDTNTVTATIKLAYGIAGGDIATGGGYVWVSYPGTPVIQIRPESNIIVHRFEVGGWGDAIRFGAGSIWVSGRIIHRIRPPD